MLSAIKNYFSPDPVNNGRQPEMDMAKGFAILFMVWVHVFEELSPNSTGALVTFVEVLGGPFAAPIFMICLGVGISYSKRNAPKDLLRRGFSLLGIGLLLNVFRHVLPDLIKYLLTRDSAYLYATFSLFSVDILQFAGLAFIFFALAKKLNIKKANLMLAGVIASVLGMLLRGVSTGSYIADQFIGYIWGTATETYFPFLNWIIFPIFGFVFGSILKYCKDKKNLYLRISPLCGALMLIYLALTIRYGLMFMSDGSYHFMGLFDALFFVILSIFVFGLCYAILQLFSKVSFKPLLRWSKNINAIYCIHWTLLCLFGIIQQFLLTVSKLQFWQGTLIAIILLFFSDRLSVMYVNKLKPTLARKKNGGSL